MVFRCFIFVLMFAPSMLTAQTVVITVLDSLDNRPVVDCNVHMLETDQSFTTNVEGKIQFIPLTIGNVSVKLTAAGYRTFHQTISLQNSSIILRMTANHLDMHEVTVSSGSTVLKQKNPFHVESRKLSDLNAISTLNLGDLIGKIPGVYAASLGNGISKPVIRGMQGMRIVTLMNGLRLEGQQWGGNRFKFLGNFKR
ncbi:MAG: hypothetical protein EBU82_15535 [Flavobacteriia bacterium]|nr:hypothetical protein [Flavobacteriia bacterium]